MRAGHVVTIRVNPEDCQLVLNLMDFLGVNPYDGRSFATCVSLSLSSLLATYQRSGHLPEVDGYQYLNRMGPFLGSKNDKRKKVAADAMYDLGRSEVGVPTIATTSHPGQYVPEHLRGPVGFTEGGMVTTAAVPMPVDTEMRKMLSEEFSRLIGKEARTEEEETRLAYLYEKISE